MLNKILSSIILFSSFTVPVYSQLQCWGSQGLGGSVFAPIQFGYQQVSWIVTSDCPPIWSWDFKDGHQMSADGLAFFIFSVEHLNTPFHGGILHPDADYILLIDISNGGLVKIAFGVAINLPVGTEIFHQVVAPTNNPSVPGGFTMTPGRRIYRSS